jgi:hypothetical protein
MSFIKNITTNFTEGNISSHIQPLTYYQEPEKNHTLNILGQVFLFITYLTILPIFAILVSSILKYLRRKDMISSSDQEEYQNEIMDNVRLASFPNFQRTQSLVTLAGERVQKA